MTYIKLTEGINQISKKINKAISIEINKQLKKSKNNIESSCKDLASSSISSQPEMVALKGGLLSGLFGLYPGSESEAVAAISQSVYDSVYVKINNVNHSLSNTPLLINFQPSTFANLMQLDQGHVKYSGGDLHWLDWLLSMGNTTIISGYTYVPSSGMGRSNLGYMSSGGSFRVPPEYSGTLTDNFVTRALTSKSFESSVSQIISKYIG